MAKKPVTDDEAEYLKSLLPAMPEVTSKELDVAMDSICGHLTEAVSKLMLREPVKDDTIVEGGHQRYRVDTGGKPVEDFIVDVMKDMNCEQMITDELAKMKEKVAEKEKEVERINARFKELEDVLIAMQSEAGLSEIKTDPAAEDMEAISLGEDDDVIVSGITPAAQPGQNRYQ